MKSSTKTRPSKLGAALLLGIAAFATPGTADASPDFPALLQAALSSEFGQSFCVPQCTACHLTTQGGPGMLNVFGTNLEKFGGLLQLQDATVASSIKTYFAMPPPVGAPLNANGQIDSDGDGVSDKDELIDYDSPSLALPRGKSQFCPDIKYGCAGGRIAPKPPPVDSLGLFSAGLVVVGFAAMRRRRRARRDG